MARVNYMVVLSTPFAFSVETLFPLGWLCDIWGTGEQVVEEQAVPIAARTVSATGLIVQHVWVCARAEIPCVLPIMVRALCFPTAGLQKEARGEVAPAEACSDSHNPGASHYLISSNAYFPLIAVPLKNMAKYEVPYEVRGAFSAVLMAPAK